MPLILTRALIPYELAAKWSSKGQAGFADPYAWHQRAWECFSSAASDAKRDFLTRVDPKEQELQLLILSPVVPTRPPWCPENGWKSKPISDEFLSRPRYRFSLLANPTRKVRTNEKGELLKNSRRVPVTHREDRADPDTGRIRRGLISWLADHGRDAGFDIDETTLKTLSRPWQEFSRPAKGSSPRHRGTLHAVDFVGDLIVRDHEKFRAAFVTGIGSAKAFGFGMLCLSPL